MIDPNKTETETDKILFSPAAMKKIAIAILEELLKSKSKIIKLDITSKGNTTILTINIKNNEGIL